MKKIIAFMLLAVITILTFAACGKGAAASSVPQVSSSSERVEASSSVLPEVQSSSISEKTIQYVEPPAAYARPVPYAKEEYDPYYEAKKKLRKEGYWVGEFSEGLVVISTGSTIGYANTEGEIVIPCELKAYPMEATPLSVHDFSEGFAMFFYEGECGYIDTTGRIAIAAQYGVGGYFQHGLAPVETDDFEGIYINTKGERVTQYNAPPSAYLLEWGDASEGLFIIVDEQERYGFMNHTGAVVIQPQYTDARPFSEGLAAVKCSDDMWGFIDKRGNMIIKPQFTEAGLFIEGRANVALAEDNQEFDSGDRLPYRFIDKQGKVITDAPSDYPGWPQAGSYYIPYGYCFNNGFALLYQKPQGRGGNGYNFSQVINLNGEPANFARDCSPVLRKYERQYVNTWKVWDEGTLFLHRDRTAELFDMAGNLIKTGTWAGRELGIKCAYVQFGSSYHLVFTENDGRAFITGYKIEKEQ